jgi:endonuclease III
MILLENASYLVDDARREETFERLRAAVGLTPEAILKHSREEIALIIAGGGMKPEMRAGKLLDCARLAVKAGVTEKTLRKFPSIGEPYADRILLFAGIARIAAVPSNGTQVLVRIIDGKESKTYNVNYRKAQQAIAAEVPETLDARTRAFGLLASQSRNLAGIGRAGADRVRVLARLALGRLVRPMLVVARGLVPQPLVLAVAAAAAAAGAAARRGDASARRHGGRGHRDRGRADQGHDGHQGQDDLEFGRYRAP